MGEQPNTDGRSARVRVGVAALLAVGFACALGAVAVGLAADAVTHHGTVGAAARDISGGRSSPAAGVWGLVVLLAVASTYLARSAVRALRHGAYLGIVVPLGILLVVGTIGEIADLLGTASATSDLIGAVILLLAAVPVALLWTPMRASLRRR